MINSYQTRMVRKHDMLSQQDIEEVLGVQSIGVIPADDKVIISQNQGIPVISMRSKVSRAFMNASRSISSPHIIPVDLNTEDPCTRQEKICLRGKEFGYES